MMALNEIDDVVKLILEPFFKKHKQVKSVKVSVELSVEASSKYDIRKFVEQNNIYLTILKISKNPATGKYKVIGLIELGNTSYEPNQNANEKLLTERLQLELNKQQWLRGRYKLVEIKC